MGGKDRAPICTWHVNLRDRDTHDLHDSEGSVCECEQPYCEYRDGQISPAMAAQREPYLPVLYPWRRERERQREVNLDKTRVMVFQKKARSQGSRYQFSYAGEVLEHSTSYSYLASRSLHRGGFSLAVKVLDEKARKAFYAIKSCFSQLKHGLKSRNH